MAWTIEEQALPSAVFAVPQAYLDTYWDFPALAAGYDTIEAVIAPQDDSTDGYYFALQWNWASYGGTGGYMGLQTAAGHTSPHVGKKIAVFSVWDVSNGTGPEYSASFGGEGTGWSVRITYDWQPERAYRCKLTKTGTSGTDSIWTGTVTDLTTNVTSTIGSIYVPTARAKVSANGAVTFHERYSGATTNASAIDLSVVDFTGVRVNSQVQPIKQTNYAATVPSVAGYYDHTNIADGVLSIVGGRSIITRQTVTANTTDYVQTATIRPSSAVVQHAVLLLFVVNSATSDSVTGVTDTSGNTWTKVAPGRVNGNLLSEFWICQDAAAGQPTITVTGSAFVVWNLILREFIGLQNSSVVDIQTSMVDSDYVQTHSLVSTVAMSEDNQAVVVGYAHTSPPDSFTPNAGLGLVTTVSGSPYISANQADGLLFTAETPQATFTTGGYDKGSMWLLTLKGIIPTPGPSVPSPPTGLIANAGNAQVSLTWNAISGATKYRVYRSSTSGPQGSQIAEVTTTGYIDTGRANGTTYYYAVAALNAQGESAGSSQVAATPVTPGTVRTPAWYPYGAAPSVGLARVVTVFKAYMSRVKPYLLTQSGMPTGMPAGAWRILNPLEDGSPTVEFDPGQTVTEGSGYWMTIFAACSDPTSPVYDPQADSLFRGLWIYTKFFLDANGLPNWRIKPDGTVAGSGSATDGDEDIGYALDLYASIHGDSAIAADAVTFANAIGAKDFYPANHSNTALRDVLINGDGWDAGFTGSPDNYMSDYPRIAAWRQFAVRTGNTTAWNARIAKNQQLSTKFWDDNYPTGFVPSAATRAGQPVSGYPFTYHYNAIRKPIFTGLDAFTSGDTTSMHLVQKIANFVKTQSGNNPANAKAESNLAGTANGGYINRDYLCGFAVAACSSSVTADFAGACVDWLDNDKDVVPPNSITGARKYFGDSLTCMSLLVMTGELFPRNAPGTVIQQGAVAFKARTRLRATATSTSTWQLVETNTFDSAGGFATSDNNPLIGLTLWRNPNSAVALGANAASGNDKLIFQHIQNAGIGTWMGAWSGDPQTYCAGAVADAKSKGQTPFLILYNIMQRDCGSASAGGAQTLNAYKAWIDGIAAGVGQNKVLYGIEPDSVALFPCDGMTQQQIDDRYAALNYALDKLVVANPNAVGYLDAGHSVWPDPAAVAAKLVKAGIAKARGFFSNMSNFMSLDTELPYGDQVVAELAKLGVANKHFIIDTSRSGNGPSPDNNWCNPTGRALGPLPTLTTGSVHCDAYVWGKVPGESDGTSNYSAGCGTAYNCPPDAPCAGEFWPSYALALASAAGWTSTSPNPAVAPLGGSGPPATIDTSRFYVRDGFASTSGDGMYRASCTTLANGEIVITPNADDVGGIESLRDQLYGRWDVWVRWPNPRKGYKPVLMLWPSSDQWVDGEVDVELTDTTGDSVEVYAHNVTGTPEVNQAYSHPSVNIKVATKVSIRWTSAYLAVEINDVEVFRTTDTKAIPKKAMRFIVMEDVGVPDGANGIDMRDNYPAPVSPPTPLYIDRLDIYTAQVGPNVISGTAAFGTRPRLAATARLIRTGAAQFRTRARLQASGVLVKRAVAAFGMQTRLRASNSPTQLGRANFTSRTRLQATGAQILAGSATFRVRSRLQAGALEVVPASAQFRMASRLRAFGVIPALGGTGWGQALWGLDSWGSPDSEVAIAASFTVQSRLQVTGVRQIALGAANFVLRPRLLAQAPTVVRPGAAAYGVHTWLAATATRVIPSATQFRLRPRLLASPTLVSPATVAFRMATSLVATQTGDTSQGAATFVVRTQMWATGTGIASGAAGFTAAATLSAVALQIAPATAGFNLATQFVANPTLVVPSAVVFGAQLELQATGTAIAFGAAALATRTQLSAEATYIVVKQGTSAFSTTYALSATAIVVQQASAVFTTSLELTTAEPVSVLAAAAALGLVFNLSATAIRVVEGQAGFGVVTRLESETPTLIIDAAAEMVTVTQLRAKGRLRSATDGAEIISWVEVHVLIETSVESP